MQKDSKYFLISYFIISIGTPGQFIFAIKKADPITGALMSGIYFITMAISSIIISRLSDKYMRRKIFALLGFLIVTSVFILYYFLSNPYQLILCSSLVGIGFASYNPTSNALFSELEPSIPSGKLMSYFFVVSSSGWSLGSIFGGILNQYFGEFVFIFAASITIIGILLYIFKVHDAPYEDARNKPLLTHPNSNNNSNLMIYSNLIVILAIALLTRHFCAQGGFALFPNYLEWLTWDPLTISLVLGVNMTFQAIIMIPIGRLVDHERFGRKIVLLLGMIGTSFTILLWSFIKTPWIMIFPQLIIGFSWPALATAATALVTDLTTRQNRSRGLGWFNTGLAVGGSVGPLISGLIFAQSGGNFNLAFQILSIVPIIGILLIIFTFSEDKKSHSYSFSWKKMKGK